MTRKLNLAGPVSVPFQATRIAGVDVDQLLHDIGEASASTSQIDLFRLCLCAQRVLSGLCVGGTDWTAGGVHEL